MLLQVPGTNVPLSHMVHIARKIDAARAARGWTVTALAWRPGPLRVRGRRRQDRDRARLEAGHGGLFLEQVPARQAGPAGRRGAPAALRAGRRPSKLYEWLIPGEVLSDLDGQRKSGHEEIPLL